MIGMHPRAGVLLPGWALLLLTSCALVIVGCRNGTNDPAGGGAEAQIAKMGTSAVAAEQAPADSLVVYYFHGNKRCRTCMGIQQAIQSTIRERFSAETGSELLVFREVNIDEPANAHFIENFELSSSSMVVLAKSGDRTVKWENCTEVWPLAHQQAELEAYVERQIKRYLKLVQSS